MQMWFLWSQDCGHFDMEIPNFSLLKDLSVDISKTQESCSKYGEFLKEKQEMGQLHWFSIREQVCCNHCKQ